MFDKCFIEYLKKFLKYVKFDLIKKFWFYISWNNLVLLFVY